MESNRDSLSNNITEKKVILGVASLWEPRKGISFFIELSKIISDEFQTILLIAPTKTFYIIRYISKKRY